MLALTLTCLIIVAAVATGLSLIDSWLRGRGAYRVLKREKALLKAGFVPQVHAHEMYRELRVRQTPRRTVAAATRTRRAVLPTFPAAA